jgi:hypothetical protein
MMMMVVVVVVVVVVVDINGTWEGIRENLKASATESRSV